MEALQKRVRRLERLVIFLVAVLAGVVVIGWKGASSDTIRASSFELISKDGQTIGEWHSVADQVLFQMTPKGARNRLSLSCGADAGSNMLLYDENGKCRFSMNVALGQAVFSVCDYRGTVSKVIASDPK